MQKIKLGSMRQTGRPAREVATGLVQVHMIWIIEVDGLKKVKLMYLYLHLSDQNRPFLYLTSKEPKPAAARYETKHHWKMNCRDPLR